MGEPSDTLQLSILAAEQAAAQQDWHAALQATAQAVEPKLVTAHPPQLAARLLLLRARAAKQLQRSDIALQALDLALQLVPGEPEALRLRAAVLAAAGNHMACFMDLRNLSEQHPAYPGVLEALQQAAQAVAQQQAARPPALAPPRKTYIRTTRRASSSSSSSRPWSQGADTAPDARAAACAVLGVPLEADLQAVRRAYKALAAQLHPDKWVRAGPSEQAAAEERFKQVAAAYQSLMEEQQPQ